VGHAACMGKGEMHIKSLSEYVDWTDYHGDLGVDMRMILNWILKYAVWECGLYWNGLGKGQVDEFCEHVDELSGSIKGNRVGRWTGKPEGFSNLAQTTGYSDWGA
jgi:hypothetical protein